MKRVRGHSEFYLTCDAALIFSRADLFFWHTENERQCTAEEGVQRVRMGVRAGIPDFIIATPVRQRPDITAVAVELKTGNNRLSHKQRQVKEQLKACGWLYLVAKSTDEVIAIVESLWPERLTR